MTKFVIVVIVIYVLYYAGNIVYDLYFKKAKSLQEEDDKEEFSIGHIADEVKNVTVDEVEEVKMSSAFEIDEEQLRASESEEDKIENKQEDNKQEIEENPIVEKQEFLDKETLKKEGEKKFKDLLSLAETSVSVVNVGGIKTWKSILPNVVNK
ncbi:MAG: hypothetical protein Q4B43_07610 [Bacteroidota bacterium]|nr:hypothetical protein [Bacteroidota bacterium]